MRRFILMLTLSLLCAAPVVLAASPDEARQFVDKVGQRVLSVMNGSGNQGQKKQQLRQLFIENVDIAWMGRFVLGRGWQQASEADRVRYSAAYKEYLLARYTNNFADYTGSKYTITDAKAEEDGQFIVNMQIKSPERQNQDTLAGYRVRTVGGQFKITDIIVEGVSLITTERSEFASVMGQKGIAGLISDIEAKTQEKGGNN